MSGDGVKLSVCEHSLATVFGSEWRRDEETGETFVVCDPCALKIEYGEEIDLYEMTVGAPEGTKTH